jgi:hypothetical protein
MGLALDGGSRPPVAAPGVGLVTSVPGRNEGGAARYGTISGSSAAAALVTGAAALVADARPDLDAVGLRGALVTTARLGRGGSGARLADPLAASSVELVADPPVVPLGAIHRGRRALSARVTVRNVSRRTLVVRMLPGTAAAGVSVGVAPRRFALRAGGTRVVRLSIRARARLAPPGALEGTVRAVVGPGTRLRIPWSVAVPVSRSPVVTRVALSALSFEPSDVRPAVLSLVAGRVDGSADRPQLLPLTWLELELRRGTRRLGTLARLRNLLPGRYAFGVTGRGPGGARLRRGRYVIRVIAAPVGGGPASTVDVPFRVK